MWRRLIDMLAGRHVPPPDGQSSHAERLDVLDKQVQASSKELHVLAVEARDRLASYRRVRLGR